MEAQLGVAGRCNAWRCDDEVSGSYPDSRGGSERAKLTARTGSATGTGANALWVYEYS